MKYSRKIWISVFWILLGAILNLCYFAGVVDDYWSGMGFTLVVVGCMQLARHIRYRTDETYREKVDVANTDERNRYLASKAWAWAGYWFVLLGALGAVGFKIAGRDELSVFCGSSVCLIMILYWLSYLRLRKKY